MASCTEKARLLRERKETTEAFRKILSLLNLSVGTASNEEFLLIKRTANEQDPKSEQASLALEKHIREHGC